VVQVAPKRDTDVDHAHAEARAVLARLERYIAAHPPRRASTHVVHTPRGDVEELDDSIGLILAASAQPAALVCCLAVLFAFVHMNHAMALVLGLAAGVGTSCAIVRRIPLSIACTVGIACGLAIALLS
jgi:hypothetical protein